MSEGYKNPDCPPPTSLLPLLLFLHASAMNDLLQTMAVAGGAGGQWAGSIENLDASEAMDGGMAESRRGGRRMKELTLSANAIDCAALTLPTPGHSRAKLRLQVKGQEAHVSCGL